MQNYNVKWENYFKNRKEIVLCTASKNGQPNGIIVISLGFVDGNLLIADCQMKKTILNLKENNNVCVIGGYFKIIGQANVFNEGKYFDMAAKKSKGYKIKHAILVKPKKLINLDKVKVLSFSL